MSKFSSVERRKISRAEYALLTRARSLSKRLETPGLIPSVLLQLIGVMSVPNYTADVLADLRVEGWLQNGSSGFRVNVPPETFVDRSTPKPERWTAIEIDNLVGHWRNGVRCFTSSHLSKAPQRRKGEVRVDSDAFQSILSTLDVREVWHDLKPSELFVQTAGRINALGIDIEDVEQFLVDHAFAEQQTQSGAPRRVTLRLLELHLGSLFRARQLRNLMRQAGLLDRTINYQARSRKDRYTWELTEKAREHAKRSERKPSISADDVERLLIDRTHLELEALKKARQRKSQRALAQETHTSTSPQMQEEEPVTQAPPSVPLWVLEQIVTDHHLLEQHAKGPLPTRVSTLLFMWHLGQPELVRVARNKLRDQGVYEVTKDGRCALTIAGSGLVTSLDPDSSLRNEDIADLLAGEQKFVAPFTPHWLRTPNEDEPKAAESTPIKQSPTKKKAPSSASRVQVLANILLLEQVQGGPAPLQAIDALIKKERPQARSTPANFRGSLKQSGLLKSRKSAPRTSQAPTKGRQPHVWEATDKARTLVAEARVAASLTEQEARELLGL